MAAELIGYSVDDLSHALTTMENSIEFGRKAKLQILTNSRPTKFELADFYSNMVAEGFHVSYPVARGAAGLVAVEISIAKGSPAWAALIPLIPTAIIAGLIVFGITRIEAITKALIPLLLITGGVVIVLAGVITRGPVMEAAGKYAARR